MKRVVVTGLGAITPLGFDVKKTWDSVLRSESSVKIIPNELFLTDDLRCKIASFIPISGEGALNPEDFIAQRDLKKMDKFIQYAVIAANQAIKDANLSEASEEEKKDIGVLIGSGIGGLRAIEENAILLYKEGARKISPFFIPSSLINLASGHVSIQHGFSGPNHAVVTACSTGTHAIGDAYKLIRDGDAKVMICGGTEAAICRLGIAGFSAARALASKFNDRPEEASRPWDKERDGFVMGEGSGVLVLEEYEYAKSKNKKIYGEVIGYGLSGDGYHITSPEPNGLGAIRAMQMAMDKAKISFDKIDYINAHGTSTPLGDMIEIKAIRKVSKDELGSVAISSTKSSIGHLLGAAGSVEAIFAILSMRDSIVPPTLNLHNPEDDAKGINLVPLKAQERNVDCVMSNSFGFGGTNSSLIFKKV